MLAGWGIWSLLEASGRPRQLLGVMGDPLGDPTAEITHPVRGMVCFLGARTTNQIAAILQGLQGLQGYKATRTIRTIRITRLQGYKAIRIQDYRM